MESEITTEQKIMDAAEHVFLDEGFSGARMQHIADRAGINKAMLHYYFRSKDKLFELVFRHKMKQFVPQIEAALNESNMTFIEKIDRFVLAYLTMLQKNPRLPIFILSTIHRNPELANSIDIKLGAEIIRLMEIEIQEGRIKKVDTHQFMLTLVGMCLFPFIARPIFSKTFDLTPKQYDQLLAERRVHAVQYARAILIGE